MQRAQEQQWNLRVLVICGVFGGLAGFIEVSLGTLLHAAHFPFKGLLLTGSFIIVLTMARRVADLPGATMLTGASAALLKLLFSIGGAKLSPFISLLLESFFLEACFSAFGLTLASTVFGGGLCALYTVLHRLLGLLLTVRGDAFLLLEESVRSMGKSLSLPLWENIVALLMAILLVRFLAGMLFGLFAWRLAEAVAQRRGEAGRDTDHA